MKNNFAYKFSYNISNLIYFVIIICVFGYLAFKNNLYYLTLYIMLCIFGALLFLFRTKEVFFYDDYFVIKTILSTHSNKREYSEIEKVIFNKSAYRGSSKLIIFYLDNKKIKKIIYNRTIETPKEEFIFLTSKGIKCNVLLKGKPISTSND